MNASPHPIEQLSVYRDLSPDERRPIDQHLAQCPDCRAALAAFERQDRALLGIRPLRPRRDLRPRPASIPRLALDYLGSGLVTAGVAALLWLFALQVQQLAQPGAAGTGIPASAVEPGIALPPTVVRLPSPWLPALPWIGLSLLAVGLLFVISRRSLWLTAAGGGLAALLLISYVPPLSALPNPLGIYWRLAGGYSYDPRLPFRNAFLVLGRPEAQLRPRLEALIGQVGLAPLDPLQPLAGYEIVRVGLHPGHNRVALVTVRFVYADGTSRLYPVPVFHPVFDHVGGLWLAGWREDGLERLRSEHLALPGQPFAGPDSPLDLAAAGRLELHPSANRLDEANPGHWLWSSVRVQQLVWRPDGSSFLFAQELAPGQRQLWLVPRDGSAPLTLADPGDVREYGWSPDGQTVVYTRMDPDAAALSATRPFAVLALEPGGRPRTLATALEADRLPGLSPEGAWFASGQSAWVAPYDGSAPRPLDLERAARPGPLWPSPDQTRVAYACTAGLCLADAASGAGLWQAAAQVDRVAWAPDGARLAVIDRDPNNLRPVGLLVFGREGQQLIRAEIAPGDAVDPPQWTPGGEAILVQTFPLDGRRIIALHLPSGQVLDLSQEHWDAYFALTPDGRALLLNNGRGDFWLADLIRR